MKLRNFEEEDATKILSWIKSEREFRMWSADQYGDYPAKPEDIVNSYKNKMTENKFYPLTFEEGGRIIGHLIMRYPTDDKELIRLGFIIVDNTIRGKGYGKKIIREAMKYAEENLGAKRFNLGVFTNNASAFECYKAVGFEVKGMHEKEFKFYDEEWNWIEMLYDPEE